MIRGLTRLKSQMQEFAKIFSANFSKPLECKTYPASKKIIIFHNLLLHHFSANDDFPRPFLLYNTLGGNMYNINTW